MLPPNKAQQRTWHGACLLLAVTACVGGPRAIAVPEGQFVQLRGTHLSGSDLTEPRARESALFRTVHAGAVLVHEGAGVYALLEAKPGRSGDLYVKAIWPNPRSPGNPIENDAVLPVAATEFGLSSPGPISGLEIYQNYTIRILVFEAKGVPKPLDELEQPFRSYVDTTGPVPLVHGGLELR